MPGHWEQVDANTLSFRPAGLGFGLGGTVHVSVPGRSISWHARDGSMLRLQEILARLGYLPVRWRAPAGTPSTPTSEVADAVSAPHGTFSWRYAGTADLAPGPVEARQLERRHRGRRDALRGRARDGHRRSGRPEVWRALMQDDLAGRRSDAGYNYVFVHETLPQSLSLWHDGRVILTSPGNTGIASAPTAQGTWPVFEHISVGTMSGTNPDGSHYHDPGIRWISYFHGGDALHEFPRASFGTPQSLGCVELPEAAAAAVWPYTPIGTLVTIES